MCANMAYHLAKLKPQIIERLKEAGVEESNIFITKNQGTIWLKSDGNSIIIEKLKELNLDGANKVSYRSIFDICSYFFCCLNSTYHRIS